MGNVVDFSEVFLYLEAKFYLRESKLNQSVTLMVGYDS